MLCVVVSTAYASSLISFRDWYSIRSLLRKISFNCVVVRHGIYVPQGLIGEVARHENVRIVTWNIAYRKGRLIFSLDDTYHHPFISQLVSKWVKMDLTEEAKEKLMSYLKPRWH